MDMLSTFSQMNWLDYSIIGIIFLSIVISFFRGFLVEAVSLVTWVLAIIFGLKISSGYSANFSHYITSPLFRYIVVFLVVFFVILILGAIVGALVRMLVRKVGIGFFDRLFGIVFGAARGVLLVAVILLFINLSAYKKADWVKESRLSPHFNILVTWLNKYIPEKLQQVNSWVNDNLNQTAELNAR